MRVRAKVLMMALLTAVSLGFAPIEPLAAVTIDGNGYQLRAFAWNDVKVRVVTFTAGNGFMIKKARSYASFSGRRTTSSIGTTTNGAELAINGDFRVIGMKAAPKHLEVIDGEIMSTGVPRLPGWVLSTSADGTQAWISRPVWSIQAVQGATQFPIKGWNAQEPKDKNVVVAFTARGGIDRYPTAPTCSALLVPVSGARGPDRVYNVKVVRKNVRCDRHPLMPPKGKWSTVVLVGKPVRDLKKGTQLQMHVDLGHQGVIRNVIGGLPHVVKYGVNVGPRCEGVCVKSGTGPDKPLYAKNPRTAIGISQGCSDWISTTSCQYWLVVVDGRSPWSEGVRFPPLGNLMLQLGAYNALNLDGGGSTTMWVRHRNQACQSNTTVGCLVNRTSYGERPIPDVVVLVPA